MHWNQNLKGEGFIIVNFLKSIVTKTKKKLIPEYRWVSKLNCKKLKSYNLEQEFLNSYCTILTTLELSLDNIKQAENLKNIKKELLSRNDKNVRVNIKENRTSI